MTGKKGFTLIELLVALAILSMLFAAVLQALTSVKKGGARAEALGNIYQMGRVTIDRITRDINMAFLVTDKKLLGTSADGAEVKTAFFGRSGGGLDAVNFTTMSHLKMYFNAKEADQAEVGYYTENDPEHEGLKVIMRRESPYIDGDIESGGASYIIATNVKKFELGYYDGRKFEWVDEWNSESAYNKDQLPRAVRVKVVFEHPYLKEKEISMIGIAPVAMWQSPIEF